MFEQPVWRILVPIQEQTLLRWPNSCISQLSWGNTKPMQLSPGRRSQTALVVTTAPRLVGKAYSQEVTADSSGYQHGDDDPVTAERKRQPWYTGPEKELPVTAFLGLRSVLSKNYKMKHETIKGHLRPRCVVNLSLPLSSLSANMSPSQC